MYLLILRYARMARKPEHASAQGTDEARHAGRTRQLKLFSLQCSLRYVVTMCFI